MKTIGVVAEYNPFHYGHAYHLAESRRIAGEDAAVIAVMSGDFVQRGEAAVYSKYARAEAACRCGADLVVELPLPWALASAEGFAKAAVKILAAMGTDLISFGSETEDLEELAAIADLLRQEDFIDRVRRMLKEHPEQNYAAARQQTAEQILGRKLDCMQRPNSILALEYLKAIQQDGLYIRPLVVLRKGAGHDEAGGGEYASASELRRRICAGESIRNSVPAAAELVFAREREAGREVSDKNRADLLMLSRLRFLKREDYRKLPDAGNGLGDRLYEALWNEPDCESESDFQRMPEFIRILAFNEKGRCLLHERKENAVLPILTKPAQLRSLYLSTESGFALNADAHDFYALHYTDRDSHICGEDWRRGPVFCT